MHTISIYPKSCLDREHIMTWKDGREFREEGTRWTLKTTDQDVDGASYYMQVQYDGTFDELDPDKFHFFAWKDGKMYEFVPDDIYEKMIHEAELHGVEDYDPPQDPWQSGINMGLRMARFREMRKKFIAMVQFIDLAYCD